MKMSLVHRCPECENDFDLDLYFDPASSCYVRNEYATPEDASCEPRCCPFCDKEVDAYQLAFES